MSSASSNFISLILKALFSLISIVLICSSSSNAQKLYNESDISRNLVAAGKNKSELLKAVSYFKKDKDPLKLEALYFLIANMDIHLSADYVWINRSHVEVNVDELKFPNYIAFRQAINEMKSRDEIVLPKEKYSTDLETISANILIDNIDNAFKAWKSSTYRNISFKNFCEYILPYRVTIEPLQNWRSSYSSKYKWISDSLKSNSIQSVLAYVGSDHKSWWNNTYNNNIREEPLPRLGGLQLLFRMTGACEDIAALQVFTLRSQGIPASYNFVPFWATSTGGHFLNSVFDEKMQHIKFDATSSPSVVDLTREPGKVIRVTYSKQPHILASIEKKDSIPSGFMQANNYLDVTDEYWETQTVQFKVPVSNPAIKIAYACVFNGGVWQPIWWGRIDRGTVAFNKMSKGAVYLPAYYSGGEVLPAGYPKGIGYSGEIELRPDLENKRSIILQEQEKYLKFRPDKLYSLYYWDKEWKLVQEKVATGNTKVLTFDEVPSNALLLLIPEYSQGKERPFMIMKDGKRYWW